MFTRRNMLLATSSLALGASMPWASAASTALHIRKPIPATGEELPVIGMGTGRTFDVNDIEGRAPLYQVLRTFFEQGGMLLDTSPMYGEAERALGQLLTEIGERRRAFVATGVWTDGQESGVSQMRRSLQRLGVRQMDLMQVQDLRDWRTHMPTLHEWKEQGLVRYIGITTSEAEQYEEFAAVMRSEPLDFVQLDYNIATRRAEEVLLPLAADRGIAVLANRPFGGPDRGNLFPRVRGRALPEWAADIDCRSWAQFFLKYIVSHPAVTCAIPATSNPMHAIDNMGAGFGRLPDAQMRERMARHFAEA